MTRSMAACSSSISSTVPARSYPQSPHAHPNRNCRDSANRFTQPVQGGPLTTTEFRSTRARAGLADKGQLGGLRSRAALLAHVLGKRIVHARLPTTAAGAEELHNLRI
jgi:hypothetical protein